MSQDMVRETDPGLEKKRLVQHHLHDGHRVLAWDPCMSPIFQISCHRLLQPEVSV
jgi:hypothetical protein